MKFSSSKSTKSLEGKVEKILNILQGENVHYRRDFENSLLDALEDIRQELVFANKPFFSKLWGKK